MSDALTDKEWIEAMALVQNIPNTKLIDEIDRLAHRERMLLDAPQCKDPDMREIVLYNMTILAAASGRVRHLEEIMSEVRKREDEENLDKSD